MQKEAILVLLTKYKKCENGENWLLKFLPIKTSGPLMKMSLVFFIRQEYNRERHFWVNRSLD